MILRRYGTAYHSVEPDFNSKAMNEVGFRRDGTLSIPVEEFEEGFERRDGGEITGKSEGDVQIEAEERLLEQLLADLRALEEQVPEGGYLVVESETGKDWPRLRSTQRTTVVGHENRLHFTWGVEPPLRAAVYAPRS
ncbi:MAG: hypothetical protein WEB88_04335 [Gemmatimonadota bacterium]